MYSITKTFRYFYLYTLLGLMLTHNYAIGQQKNFDLSSQSQLQSAANVLINQVEKPEQLLEFNFFQLMIQPIINKIPSIEKIKDQLAVLNEKKREAFSGYLPQVSTLIGAGQSQANQTQTQIKPSSISAKQLIYDFKSTPLSNTIAERQYEAGLQSNKDQYSETVLTLVKSILEKKRSTKMYDFVEGYVVLRKDFANIIKEKEKLGANSSIDIIRAATKLAEAEDELPGAQKAISNADQALRELFGELVNIDSNFYQLPSLQYNHSNEDNIIMSMPKVKEAEINLVISKNNYELDKAKMYGTVQAEVSNSDSSSSLSSLLSGTSNTRQKTYQIVYKADLFSGFAGISRVEQSLVKVSQNQFAYEEVVRKSKKDLANSVASLKASQDSLRSRLAIAKGSMATEIGTRELFLLNRGSLTDVFKAQEDYFQAVQKLVNAQFDYQMSYFTLMHQSGLLLDLFKISI
jgi:outer membrane protein